MAYNINKTDGTLLATVPDGQIDILSSDITLIGKNYSGFGEALNENLVKILENFASSTRPSRPVRGQLWYDVSEGKLKIYSGTGFVPVSSATVSNSQPADLGLGDLWYNSQDKQLYFFDGTVPVLLGPDYSVSQGLSGLRVSTILDKNNVNRVITSLYNNGTLVGIFSTARFIPKIPIVGFNDDTGLDKVIEIGFNQGYLSGLKFVVTADNALKLNGTDATLFARTDSQNRFTAQTLFSTDDGISFGAGLLSSINVASGSLRIVNNAANRNMEFRVRRVADSELAVQILSNTREIKLYDGFPDSLVTIGGGLTVNGDLTVNGTTTTINSVNLTVDDKIIELASSAFPTDSAADGGGIILKGASDHKIIWIYDTASSGQANEAWNSTENINLATGKEYFIDGVPVLSKTALGSTITSIPGVTSFGVQTVINIGPVIPPATSPVAYLRLQDNRLSTLQTNQDLELAPNGTGNIVLIGSPKIIGLETTNETAPQQSGPTKESATTLGATELGEATSKKYVTNLVRTRSLAFTFDITDSPTDAQIAAYLNQIAPVDEYEQGTLARVLCTSLSNSTSSLNINPLITKNNTVEYNTPSGTNFPIQDFAISNGTVPAQTISVFRLIKTFVIVGATWQIQP